MLASRTGCMSRDSRSRRIRYQNRWDRAAAIAVVMAVAAPLPAAGDERCGPSVSEPIENTGGVPPGLGEASGLAASLRYPGVAWAHQDSGHDASIFALRFNDDGRATWMRKIPVPGAHNADWEDVSYDLGADGVGHLYLVESGDFGSRVIYEIKEPDPDTGQTAEVLGRYRYALPDGNTTVEASFMFQGRLALATKTFPARVYLFQDPLHEGGENRPVFQGKLEDGRAISMARVSSDGQLLITASHEWFLVYRNPTPGRLAGFFDREPFHGGEVSSGDNVEAGDFIPVGGCRVVLVAESRNTYVVGAR